MYRATLLEGQLCCDLISACVCEPRANMCGGGIYFTALLVWLPDPSKYVFRNLILICTYTWMQMRKNYLSVIKNELFQIDSNNRM